MSQQSADQAVHEAARAGLRNKVAGMLAADASLIDAKGMIPGRPCIAQGKWQWRRCSWVMGLELTLRDEDHDSTPVNWRIGETPDVGTSILARTLPRHTALEDFTLNVPFVVICWLFPYHMVRPVGDEAAESVRTHGGPSSLPEVGNHCHHGAMRTVFEAAGSIDGLRRLAAAWHRRVMADEVVSHAFSHGFHPQHVERLAAYWAEALGGPRMFSESYGDETAVVRIHSGNGVHAEMDGRAIACFDQALADAGLASDSVLRQVLHDYFAWATTTTMARYHRSANDVPEGLSIPRWSWDGLQG